MENNVVRIELIKLSYNETKKCITAKRVLSFSDGHKEEKMFNNLAAINKLLASFEEQESLSVSQLVSMGLIIIDKDKLKDTGVIILDSENNYHKYFFNRDNGTFSETRMTRAESSSLGISFAKEPENNEITEEKDVSQSIDIFEIARAIQELNKDAVIRVGNPEYDSEATRRFYSSVPASELILPKGFYYNEKNGITNKHNTKTGSYCSIDVLDLSLADEKKLLPKEEIEEENLDEVDDSMDDDIKEEKEEVVLDEKKENKEKKGVKNLRIRFRRVLAIATGIVLIGGAVEIFKHTKNNNNARSVNNNSIQYQDDMATVYVDSTHNIEEEVITPNMEYEQYGSIVHDEDMESQIQQINDYCFSYEPCSLADLVVESDKNAIKVINNLRNKTLNNQYEIYMLLNQYVNYIFEGTTMFNGNAIKAYDYLSPYAKYIVVTSAQSMLGLCQDYDYFTAYNNYTYGNLVDAFDNLVDQLYRDLNVRSKTL